MWAFNKREDRRNSASVVELRRAAKIVSSRHADPRQSPSLRRANSCKESDAPPKTKAHVKPPYPDYYDSDFQGLGNKYDSDGEIGSHRHHRKLPSTPATTWFINNGPSHLDRYSHNSGNGYSSLNYHLEHFTQARSVKDLRSVDSCPTIHGQNTDEDISNNNSASQHDKRSRNNSYSSSSRHHSLTDIPEDNKEKKRNFQTAAKDEGSSLFLPNDNCSITSYHSTDHFFKVMLVGDSGVGKTCLITKFRDGIFLSGSFIPTVGIDSKSKVLSVDDQSVHLQMWDTAGQGRFRTLLRSYCRSTQAVVLQYDVRNRVSFINIRDWLTEVRDNCREEAVILLIGNKCDLAENDRAVTREEGEALGQQLNMPFLETSAKSGVNVNLLFMAIARQLMSLSEDGNAAPFDIRDYVSNNDANRHGLCSICRIC